MTTFTGNPRNETATHEQPSSVGRLSSVGQSNGKRSNGKSGNGETANKKPSSGGPGDGKPNETEEPGIIANQASSDHNPYPEEEPDDIYDTGLPSDPSLIQEADRFIPGVTKSTVLLNGMDSNVYSLQQAVPGNYEYTYGHWDPSRTPASSVHTKQVPAAGNCPNLLSATAVKNQSKGISSNRKPNNGSSDSGKPSSGKPGNGKPVNGQPANKKTVNGKPANGKPANGKPANGKPVNGKPVNGTPSTDTSVATGPIYASVASSHVRDRNVSADPVFDTSEIHVNGRVVSCRVNRYGHSLTTSDTKAPTSCTSDTNAATSLTSDTNDIYANGHMGGQWATDAGKSLFTSDTNVEFQENDVYDASQVSRPWETATGTSHHAPETNIKSECSTSDTNAELQTDEIYANGLVDRHGSYPLVSDTHVSPQVQASDTSLKVQDEIYANGLVSGPLPSPLSSDTSVSPPVLASDTSLKVQDEIYANGLVSGPLPSPLSSDTSASSPVLASDTSIKVQDDEIYANGLVSGPLPSPVSSDTNASATIPTSDTDVQFEENIYTNESMGNHWGKIWGQSHPTSDTNVSPRMSTPDTNVQFQDNEVYDSRPMDGQKKTGLCVSVTGSNVTSKRKASYTNVKPRKEVPDTNVEFQDNEVYDSAQYDDQRKTGLRVPVTDTNAAAMDGKFSADQKPSPLPRKPMPDSNVQFKDNDVYECGSKTGSSLKPSPTPRKSISDSNVEFQDNEVYESGVNTGSAVKPSPLPRTFAHTAHTNKEHPDSETLVMKPSPLPRSTIPDTRVEFQDNEIYESGNNDALPRKQSSASDAEFHDNEVYDGFGGEDRHDEVYMVDNDIYSSDDNDKTHVEDDFGVVIEENDIYSCVV